MRKIISIVAIFYSVSIFAETQSEFIKRTKARISFDQRIELAITSAYRRYKDFGVQGFQNGYACQDIGKAQFAIDLAMHKNMEVKVLKTIHRDLDGIVNLTMEQVDLDDLYENLNRVQNEICILK